MKVHRNVVKCAGIRELFEQSTGSECGHFAPQESRFAQILEPVVTMGVKILINSYFVASSEVADTTPLVTLVAHELFLIP